MTPKTCRTLTKMISITRSKAQPKLTATQKSTCRLRNRRDKVLLSSLPPDLVSNCRQERSCRKS